MNDAHRPAANQTEKPQGQRASEALATIQERVAKGELTEQEAQELMEQEAATADSAAA